MNLRLFFLVGLSFLGAPVLLFSVHLAGAQVMTSTNYQIQSDSINVGGGLSTSTSYILESTEGEVASGRTSSASYSLRAGYQQMQEVYLAMTAASNIVMNTPIGGITGGVSNGSTTVTVTTDSLSGYQLTIKAENNPAMQSGVDTISDYVPAVGVPDFTFTTATDDAHLGYTPEGADIVQRFHDDGATCGVGVGDILSACWDGLSTTAVPIASAPSANHPIGADTHVRFRVGIGGMVNQPAGTYIATTTLTALPL
jgi:hypothetical protein